MSSLKPILKEKKIIQCNVQMPITIENISITMNVHAHLKEATSNEKNNFLFEVTLNGTSQDNDEFKLSLKTLFVFEFNENCKTINDISEDVYMPFICNIMYEDIDNTLKCLGYPSSNFSSQQV